VSHVYVVRHAQASFLEADYDRLSALGEEQARHLGKYWVRQNFKFDRVCSGPRLRQIRTAEIVLDTYKNERARFSEPVLMSEFDEYHGDEVMKHALPQLLETDCAVRELHQAYLDSRNKSERVTRFQRLYESVIRKWMNGELLLTKVESWPEFSARVHRGLSRFLSLGNKGERTAIFCSGGPVAVAVQRALDLSPQNTLRVAWMVRNCAFSEVLYSGNRFTLSTFNAFPHLEDPALLTYR
jgi:broad specificity phosphatase PhoE